MAYYKNDDWNSAVKNTTPQPTEPAAPTSGIKPPSPQQPEPEPASPVHGGESPDNNDVESNKEYPGGGSQDCGPGEVYRTDGMGHHNTGQPGCEPEDWRSKNDMDTCDEGAKPNCGPDHDAWCDFSTATWKCGYVGGGGKGGAGGAAPKLASGSALGGVPGMSEADVIWQEIMKQLNGPSRYTPEVMASLQGQNKMTSEQMKVQQSEEALAGMARRGMARAPFNNAAFRQINATASGQMMQTNNAIAKAKIDADYQDKVAAIEAAQRWLDSLRDFIARQNATNAAKDAAMANVTLGYARLQQELQMMRESYAQQANLLILKGGV